MIQCGPRSFRRETASPICGQKSVHDFYIGRLFDTSKATESHKRLFVGGVQSPTANSASGNAFEMRANHFGRSLAGNRDIVPQIAPNIRIDPKLVQSVHILPGPGTQQKPPRPNGW
jgi:hypothetical protein